jgi:hypothetical protein
VLRLPCADQEESINLLQLIKKGEVAWGHPPAAAAAGAAAGGPRTRRSSKESGGPAAEQQEQQQQAGGSRPRSRRGQAAAEADVGDALPAGGLLADDIMAMPPASKRQRAHTDGEGAGDMQKCMLHTA